MVQRELLSLIIVCAGGHASEIASYVRELQAEGEPIVLNGFIDDYRFDTHFEGAPILGRLEHLGALVGAAQQRQFFYLTALRDNRARHELVRRIELIGATNLAPWTLRHSTAVVGDSVEVGAGTFIGPGAVIAAHASIGGHCILNVHSSVARDSAINAFVNVEPGVSIGRRVTLGMGCSVGAGAIVTDNVQVGQWSVIRPGAVVEDDVPAQVTVAGAPARIIQRHARGIRNARLAG